MAGPLSPLSPTTMNARTPDTTCRSRNSFITAPSATKPSFEEDEITWDDNTSSPFEAEVDENKPPATDYFNLETPSKRRSPVKLSSARPSPTTTPPVPKESVEPKMSAIKTSSRSPLVDATPRAPNNPMPPPIAATSAARSPKKSCTDRMREAQSEEKPLRDNEGLTMAINMMEQRSESQSSATHSVVEESEYFESTSFTVNEDANIDDTCFSTFSEIPNMDMTEFAKLGQRSPTKQFEFAQTPRAGGPRTPGSSRKHGVASNSPSPTPRRTNKSPVKEGDTTNLLLDFTQQFETFATLSSQQSPTRRVIGSPPKMATEPDLRSFYANQRSPRKHSKPMSTPMTGKKTILNLLDFELPPAPTPRSIPTITVRELESLKSQHLSEISSLKATLSGREAEVDSLKRAVGDAERRAGEAAESVREERNAREHAEKEKADWERRGKEFEDVLRKIREEVIASEKEREDLMQKLEEVEKRAEDADTARADAEARAAEASSRVVSTATDGENSADSERKNTEGLYTAEQVQKQIDEKIHALSTELHAIYKKKHVTKVAGLKKGFEAKTKERTAELERRIEELTKHNDELQIAKDATLSGVHVLPSELGALHEDRKRLEEQKAEFEEQKARMAGLAEEVRSMREQHSVLVKELESERVEKGELVAAVDEMLALQADNSSMNLVEDFRKSIARPSGLKGPGFGIGESRIGRVGGPAVTPALNRSVSGGKSRIMSDIERMGGR